MSGTDMKLSEWFKRFFTKTPHFIVWTDAENGTIPQLLRWWLIPRNRFFNVYLHKTVRNDEDRALHDHPWASLSFLIKGSLGEVYREREDHVAAEKRMNAPAIRYRSPTFSHRLFLPDDKPAWTIFITGPKIRNWGFWCPKGWVPWQKFCQIDDPGKPKGCGED